MEYLCIPYVTPVVPLVWMDRQPVLRHCLKSAVAVRLSYVWVLQMGRGPPPCHDLWSVEADVIVVVSSRSRSCM